MFVKVSPKDRALYVIFIVFFILDLTKSNIIWSSQIGYYTQIVTRIIGCIVLSIIVILDLIDLCWKSKNKDKSHNKKQILKITSIILIKFIALALYIITLIAYI